MPQGGQKIAVKPSIIAPPVFKRRVSSGEYIDRCVHMSTLYTCTYSGDYRTRIQGGLKYLIDDYLIKEHWDLK